MNTTRANLNTLKDFMPTQQLAFMQRLTHGEEGEYFVNKFEEMANTVSTMPKTYETEGVAMDDKNIVLHYFYANLDWYIIEKDMEEGEPQYLVWWWLHQHRRNHQHARCRNRPTLEALHSSTA